MRRIGLFLFLLVSFASAQEKPDMYKPKELCPPLVDFNRLEGWTAEARDIGVRFERDAGRAIFGRHCGSLVTSGGGPDSAIFLRPPAPLPISCLFNRVSVWIHLDELRTPATGFPRIVFEYSPGPDADVRRVTLPLRENPGWQLYAKHLTELQPADSQLHGIGILGLGAPGDSRSILIDSVGLSLEHRKRVKVERAPARPLDLVPGQQPGRNRSSEQELLFPVLRSGAAPLDDPSLRAAFSATDHADDRIELTTRTRLGTAVYTLDLPRGLAGITASWNGAALPPLLPAARLLGETNQFRVLSVQRLQQRVRVLYLDGLSLTIHQRDAGLEILVARQGGTTRGLDLGIPSIDTSPVLPFWRLGPELPVPIQVLRAGDTPLLFAAYLDPFLTNASRLHPTVSHYDRRHTGDPGIRRARHDLFERILLRLSPRVQDLLPAPAAPLAPKREQLSNSLHLGTVPVAGVPVEISVPGVRVVYEVDPALWRCPAGLSCLASTPMAEDEQQLTKRLTRARAGQHLVALPIDITRIHPLQPSWDTRALARSVDGNWIPDREGSYRVKSAMYGTWAEDIGERLQTTIAPDALFVAGFGRAANAAGLDMDQRLAGSGTLTQEWFDRGESLTRLRERARAALLIHGGNEWQNAGLADGIRLPAELNLQPFRPWFARNRLTPHSVAYLPQGEMSVEAWASTCLVYGLHPELDSRQEVPRFVHTLLPVLHATAHRPVVSALFHAGEQSGTWLEAMEGGFEQRSQIQLVLKGNIRMWVNGHPQSSWSVDVEGKEVTLPPHGWLVNGPGLHAIRGLSREIVFAYTETPDRLAFDPNGSDLIYRNGMGSHGYIEARGMRYEF